MLKKLWTSIPQLSLFIVILALLKNFLYYYNFNVPIKYYIGISELGLLIAGDLLILVPLVLLMYFMTLFDSTSPVTKKENRTTEEKISSPNSLPTKKGNIRKFFDKVMPIILIGIFALTLIGGPLLILFISNSFSDKLICFSFLLVDIFFILFITRNEKLTELITPNGMTLSLFLIMFLIMFISKTSEEINSTEKGEYKGTKIITTDSTYTSTDSAFYIGQTTNYIFFYNKNDKHTTIIPISEVKKLELYTK